MVVHSKKKNKWFLLVSQYVQTYRIVKGFFRKRSYLSGKIFCVKSNCIDLPHSFVIYYYLKRSNFIRTYISIYISTFSFCSMYLVQNKVAVTESHYDKRDVHVLYKM